MSHHATFLRRFVSTFAWRVFCEAVLADAVCPVRRCGTTPHVSWKKKSRILCFRSVCSKSKNKGIHKGIRGGSRGDPGPKRGIRVIHVISKQMKTGGSTACSSPLYNINKRQRGVTEARKAFRFLEFYLPSGSVHGLWSRLGFLGRWFWPLTSSK